MVKIERGMVKPLKITFLLAVVAACWPYAAGAGVRIGAQGGLTWMSWEGDRPDRGAYKQRAGFAIGALFEAEIAGGVALSLQPSFTQKGSKIAFEVEGEEERIDSVDVELDYLSVPILLKVNTGNPRFYVAGGFEFTCLLRARYVTPSEDVDIKEELESYDAVVSFGVGYLIPVRRSNMLLEVRYSQSIRNVVDSRAGSETVAARPRVKNSGIQFLVGFMYGL
jgi:hypothetical protein